MTILALVGWPTGGFGADLELTKNGHTSYCILTQAEASAPERHAAAELAHFLEKITGAAFPVRQAAGPLPRQAILVGPGAATRQAFPEVDLQVFGPEELVMRSKGQWLLLAGGRPRGTLYAVYRFLQESCGCRWWAPWAATIPARPTLTISSLDRREQPAFRWRDPCWYSAFDGEWAVRNQVNGTGVQANEATGGNLHYAGFVHTFYPLVPPDEHYRSHPEWFSLIDGKRSTLHGQLCLTNPRLRQFVVQRVKQVIRDNPQASIVSLSQNDAGGHCQCSACRAVDEEQGSPAGSLLAFVNQVAEEVEKAHPHVLIDTLAYSYSRKPPRTLRARPNVAVRVCSIECDFGVPFYHPRNADYAADLQEWRGHCSNLFVWDYTSNLAHYVLPHPNWFVLGPNLRFFQRHSVVSVFAQGAAPSKGGELPELRAWLLARLMWDPRQDDQALIDEFLAGYYGAPAAPFIRQYLNLMRQALGNAVLSCYNPPEHSPFLKFAILQQAERLWEQALQTASGDADKAWRIEQGLLSVRYAFLVRWSALKRECREAGAIWPLPQSRQAVAADWLRVATGKGPEKWSPLEALEEFPGLIRPTEFFDRLSIDPDEGPALIPRSLGMWPAIRGWLFGSPRGFLWLAALPLIVSLIMQRWLPLGQHRKICHGLAWFTLVCLAVALSYYLWQAPQLRARQVGILGLMVLVAVVVGILRLFLQLLALGRWRAVIAVTVLLAMLAGAAALDYHYLLLRLKPQAATNYQRAALQGAALCQANLDRANLQEADLSRACLRNAWLNFADLRRARLCNADLRGAMLIYTNLQGADLRGADLRQAQIQDITVTSLTGAIYDQQTRLPDDLDPNAWDMVFVGQELGGEN